jgi:putative membrane protein
VRPAARWPAAVYGTGDEPDPRFTLANERTLLAWLRTSLALIGTGAAGAVLADSHGRLLRVAVALVAVTGTVLAPLAVVRWARIELALRRREPLPSSRLILGAVAALVLIGVLVVVFVVGR